MRAIKARKIEDTNGSQLGCIMAQSGWPVWKGIYTGYDPLFNGWRTAAEAVNALHQSNGCTFPHTQDSMCKTCWNKHLPLLEVYWKENPPQALTTEKPVLPYYQAYGWNESLTFTTTSPLLKNAYESFLKLESEG